jgi:hypothetical protein
MSQQTILKQASNNATQRDAANCSTYLIPSKLQYGHFKQLSILNTNSTEGQVPLKYLKT